MSTWEKWNKAVAAPLGLYIILLLSSFFIFCVAELVLETPASNMFGNIGYGVFSSTIVAFLIDYASTKRKSEGDKKMINVLTGDVKTTINALIRIRNIYDNTLPETVNDLKFSDWLRMYIIGDHAIVINGEKTHLRDIFLGILYPMKEFAESLKDKSSLLFDNQYLPEDFFYHLDQLLYYLRCILNEKGNINYSLLFFSAENILKEIVILFPEYRSDFFEKWNSYEMTKKYGSVSKNWESLLKYISKSDDNM